MTSVRTVLRSPAFWITAIVSVLYLTAFAPYWKPNWDSAMYLSLARSLVNGEGYVYMGHPHAKYPPGMPLLLAPMELFGMGPVPQRLLMAALAVASVWLTFALIREVAGSKLAWPVALMTALTPMLLVGSTYVQSDVPFLFVSLATLHLYTRATRGSSPPSPRLLAAVSAMACLAFLLRTVGLVLPVALVTTHFLTASEASGRQRLRQTLLLGGPFLAVCVLWTGYSAAARSSLPEGMPGSTSYADQFLSVDPSSPLSEPIGPSEFLARVTENGAHYHTRLGRMASGKKRPISPNPIGVLLLLGWVVRLLGGRSVLEIYTGLYAAVVLAWPYQQGGRFLIPMIPFVMFYCLSGGIALVDALLKGLRRSDWRLPVHAVVLALTATAYLGTSSRGLARAIEREHKRPYFWGVEGQQLEAMEWIGASTRPDSMVIADRAAWVHWISHRHAYALPPTYDAGRLQAFVEKVGATHVVETNVGVSAPFLEMLLDSDPDRFQKVWESERVAVYEIVPAAEIRVEPEAIP